MQAGLRNKLIAIGAIPVIAGGYYFMILQKPKQPINFQLGRADLSVEIADSAAEQYQGLSGRQSLCSNCGMLFVYDEPRPQRFVMRGMRFPLDFAFIRDGVVVEIVENVPPPAPGQNPQFIDSVATADMVLELNAGFVSKNKIKVGDSAGVDQNP